MTGFKASVWCPCCDVLMRVTMPSALSTEPAAHVCPISGRAFFVHRDVVHGFIASERNVHTEPTVVLPETLS